MCGIVGLIGNDDVVQPLLEGLKRLEYRGYDSAGIATIYADEMHRRRAEGKLRMLEEACIKQPIQGNIGIGHTRWATHGIASETNAHPHANHRIALVHNGIIENYSELKEDLSKKYDFLSQTDSEVVVHLIEDELARGLSPLEAIQHAVKKLKGAYALAILFKEAQDHLYAVRQGSPLVVGMSDEWGAMLGSDAISVAPWANQICYLEDGDIAELSKGTIHIFDKSDEVAVRPFVKNHTNVESIGKGQYRHYMLKEIFEQPTVLGNALEHILANQEEKIHLSDFDIDFTHAERISIIACGSSYIAALAAKYWFEKFAGIHVDVDIASEFRYRNPVFSKNHYCFFISQSGETLDTFAALELCKGKAKTIGIVNVPQSSIARHADHVIYTHAGPEIGVASTKAFMCQMLCLLAIALEAGRQRSVLKKDHEKTLIQALRTLPSLVHQTLREENIEALSHRIAAASHVIFLGRGTSYPIAMEGALKLKEITYIPAQAYAAGELKHGPIALVDEHVPILFLAPFDSWFEKTIGNIQEVYARKGNITVFTDIRGAAHLMNALPGVFIQGQNLIVLPEIEELLQPFLLTLPLQLLAYYTGLRKGTDVDQPRNLAKSVTVE